MSDDFNYNQRAATETSRECERIYGHAIVRRCLKCPTKFITCEGEDDSICGGCQFQLSTITHYSNGCPILDL